MDLICEAVRHIQEFSNISVLFDLWLHYPTTSHVNASFSFKSVSFQKKGADPDKLNADYRC